MRHDRITRHVAISLSPCNRHRIVALPRCEYRIAFAVEELDGQLHTRDVFRVGAVPRGHAGAYAAATEVAAADRRGLQPFRVTKHRCPGEMSARREAGDVHLPFAAV